MISESLSLSTVSQLSLYKRNISVTVDLRCRLYDPDLRSKISIVDLDTYHQAYKVENIFDKSTGLTRSVFRRDDSEEYGVITGDDVSYSADDLVIRNIKPRKVVFNSNSFREPDILELELDISDMPFPADGSLLRSITVEAKRWFKTDSGTEYNIDPDGTFFIGFVDTHSIEFGENTRVKLKCRDVSCVLADTIMRERQIDMYNLNTVEAVLDILARIPAAYGIDVVWVGDEDPPMLGKMLPVSKQKEAKKKKDPKGDKRSVLEALSDFCTLSAVMMTFKGTQLWIAPSRVLNRSDADVIPKVIYGKDLESLEFAHDMGGAKTRPISVRSFNPDTGEVIEGEFPSDKNKTPIFVPPGATEAEESKPLVFTVNNVVDKHHLTSIAKHIFEEMARQEISGSFKTKEIATSKGVEQSQFDLLSLRAGDPIGIEISPAVEGRLGSQVQYMARMHPLMVHDALSVKGYDTAAINRLVNNILSSDTFFVYRVKNIRWDWNPAVASNIEVEFVNYIDHADSAEEILSSESKKVESIDFYKFVKDNDDTNTYEQYEKLYKDVMKQLDADEISVEMANEMLKFK